MLFKALGTSFVLRDNQVLYQLTAKPKAIVQSQLNFRLFVSCQLKFWPFVSCQLTPSRPSIESSGSLKLLGVTIDDQLNFNIHINEICKRASQRVGVMMRLKKLIPTNAKLTLYKSAILPYLTYCHLTWHLCTACNKRKLERMQERALRALFLDKQSSYKAPLDKGDLITLQNRRLKDIAILMYKVKHKLCPTKISELFHMHCTPYNLRVAVFAIPRFKTKKYDKHSLTYLGPKLRNRLPGEIRTLPTSDEF